MSQALLLRTMTLKSKFIGGKYDGLTVQSVINVHPNYVARSYFDMSMISFVSEVLDMVGITEEYRIKKPGTNKELRHKFFKEKLDKHISEHKTELEKIKEASHVSKVRRIKAHKRLTIQASTFSPLTRRGRLQATNQGRFRK